MGNRSSFNIGFHNAFAVDCVGRSGGLLLLWKKEWDVMVRSFSRGHIDAEVVSPDDARWRFTGFYGNPNAAERRFSWELLCRLRNFES